MSTFHRPNGSELKVINLKREMANDLIDLVSPGMGIGFRQRWRRATLGVSADVAPRT